MERSSCERGRSMQSISRTGDSIAATVFDAQNDIINNDDDSITNCDRNNISASTGPSRGNDNARGTKTFGEIGISHVASG